MMLIVFAGAIRTCRPIHFAPMPRVAATWRLIGESAFDAALATLRELDSAVKAVMALPPT